MTDSQSTPGMPDRRTWLPELHSPVWRWLLYAASGTAWLVISSLGIGLITSAWSESPLAQWLDTPVRWVAWLLVPLLVLVLLTHLLLRAVGQAPNVDAAIRSGELVAPGRTAEPRPPWVDDETIDRVADRLWEHRWIVVVAKANAGGAEACEAVIDKLVCDRRVDARHVRRQLVPERTDLLEKTVVAGLKDDGLAFLEVRDRPLDKDEYERLLALDENHPLVLVRCPESTYQPPTAKSYFELGSGPTGRKPGLPAGAGHRLLVRALARLPVSNLDADAIVAVWNRVSAELDLLLRTATTKQAKLCRAVRADLRTSVVVILNELVRDQLLVRSGAGRYRLPYHVHSTVVNVSISGNDKKRALEEQTEHALNAALPALLQHFSDLAARWTTALGHQRHANVAARWFTSEEPVLRALIMACYPDEQNPATIREVARIADSLDAWYVRERQPGRALRVAGRVRELARAKAVDEPAIAELAAIREAAAIRLLGKRGEYRVSLGAQAPSTSSEPPKWHRLVAALKARELHEEGARHLARAVTDTGVDRKAIADAERKLSQAWDYVPRSDIRAEVGTLINLAIVHLYQGRLDAAHDRLELAESLTNRGKAPDARAHALELRGITAWSMGRPRRAMRLWCEARELFDELGMTDERRRCVRQLGAAVVAAPGLAWPLVEIDRELSSDGLARTQVREWLNDERPEPQRSAVRAALREMDQAEAEVQDPPVRSRPTRRARILAVATDLPNWLRRTSKRE